MLGVVVVLLSCVGGAVASASAAARFSASAFTPSDLEGLVVGDFNGDAAPDVAAIDVCNGVEVFLGRRDGNLAKPVTSCGPFDYEVEGSAVADVNGDGRLDIGLIRFGEDGRVSTWINDGGGRFHRMRVARSGTWSDGLVAAGLNGDGVTDFVTENQARRELVVLLGLGGGRFGAPRRYTGAADGIPADAGFGAVAVGDVNGDGKPDAVLTSFDTRLAVVRLGNGDGTFGPEIPLGRGAFGGSVALADLDHDGKLDVAASLDGGEVGVFLGRGDGTPSAMTRYAVDRGDQNFLEDVALADFDGDRNIDLATISLSRERLLLLPGRGDGTFGPLQTVRGVPSPYGGPVVADFNRDARADLTYIASPRPSPNGGIAVALNSTGLPVPPCVPGPLLREPLRDARRDIKRGGCRLGRVRHRFSRKVRRNRVTAQWPRSGAILPSGARVSLTVSRGRRR